MKQNSLSTRLGSIWVVAMFVVAGGGLGAAAATTDPPVLSFDFIDLGPSIPACYTSTIVETPEALLAAWVGASAKGAIDAGIWLSRNAGEGWSRPIEVANGADRKKGRRLPCWNPVLFRRFNGDLLLFYKVGLTPQAWRGMLRLSRDEGRSWLKVIRLPSGYTGPMRVKPIELVDGLLVCGAGRRDRGWRVHAEYTYDPSGEWAKSSPLNHAFQFNATDPVALHHEGDEIQFLCRTKQGWITECRSLDRALTWSPMTRSRIPNPNTGIDVAKLDDGRFVLVYSHSRTDRDVLNLAVSVDGQLWEAAGVLEHESGATFEDPAIIETEDDLLHITYTCNGRKIKHTVIDPAQLRLRSLPRAPAR